MPLSDDPAKRARQLANLPNLRGEPTATTFAPGEAAALKHGSRSRQPQRSPDWSPAVTATAEDLAERVGSELRTEAGDLQPWAVPSVEAVALARVAAARGERHAADLEAKGKLTLEDLERQSKVTERYHRALEREALTLRSRLGAAATSLDVAQAMSDGTFRLAADDD